MKRIVLLVAVGAALLSGCATLGDDLNTLIGQDVGVAIARLGYPDGQREVLGDTIYVWSQSHTGMLPYQTSQYTSGMIGTTPISGTTVGTAYMPVNSACTIQLAVGPDRIIKSWQGQGDAMGCAAYTRAMHRR